MTILPTAESLQAKDMLYWRGKSEQDTHVLRSRFGGAHLPHAVRVGSRPHPDSVAAVAHDAIPLLQEDHLTMASDPDTSSPLSERWKLLRGV